MKKVFTVYSHMGYEVDLCDEHKDTKDIPFKCLKYSILPKDLLKYK